MKKVLSFLTLALTILLCGCQSDEMASQQLGYLKVNVDMVEAVNTRGLDKDTYNPKQIAVVIEDANGNVVNSTENSTEWSGVQIPLAPGTYKVKASSNGFDGNESGFDIPYYYAEATVKVKASTSQDVSLTCTLATVKVTVNFSDSFKRLFSKATVNVSSGKDGITPLSFVMGEDTESKAAYFPVSDLHALVSVTGEKGDFSQTRDITGVKARDHYILNYDVNDNGSSKVTITANDTEREYTFFINVGDFKASFVAVNNPNDASRNDAWSTFAFLSGVAEGIEMLPDAEVTFEYKKADAEEYTSIKGEAKATTRGDDAALQYVAKVVDLTPATSYTYHMKCVNGEDTYTSADVTFTTEGQPAIVNGSMDDWYGLKGSGFLARTTQYACSENYYKEHDGSWWDSSNPGTTTGAGALANKNPTTGVDSPVHTPGGKSAQLASTSALGVLAAASLYTGRFNGLVGTSGAKLDWGRPFEGRPVALRAYYQYKPGEIDIYGSKTPESLGVAKGDIDKCNAFVVLLHIDEPNANGTAMTIDNTRMETIPDWNVDNRVVAYGELPIDQCVSTDGQWKELYLPLKYSSLNVRPTHIMILFAASRYGDYFTGSTSSVMHVDDIELVYGNNPTTK